MKSWWRWFILLVFLLKMYVCMHIGYLGISSAMLFYWSTNEWSLSPFHSLPTFMLINSSIFILYNFIIHASLIFPVSEKRTKIHVRLFRTCLNESIFICLPTTFPSASLLLVVSWLGLARKSLAQTFGYYYYGQRLNETGIQKEMRWNEPDLLNLGLTLCDTSFHIKCGWTTVLRTFAL